MLAEAGTMVIIHSETSPVPTWAERPLSQGRSHFSKSNIKKARLKFANAHRDKDANFFRQFELFGYNDHCYI